MNSDFFCLQKGNIFAVPIIHYNMEIAAQVRLAFEKIQPDCVAVELAETLQPQLLHAASRLPDISVVIAGNSEKDSIYYMCEPCDGAFEAIRSAQESQIPAHCIDLDINYYPDTREKVPDPYAIQRIGFKRYFESYEKAQWLHGDQKYPVDIDREVFMARKLKGLSLSYDRILFVCGMSHVRNILSFVDRPRFPDLQHVRREHVEICTLSEKSSRETMAECGWISTCYEEMRTNLSETGMPDRQKLIYDLYKLAGRNYTEQAGYPFPSYHLRNLMKFVRNYACIKNQLMPDLFKIIAAAKGCVDHNYAYHCWELATSYPYLKNIDSLPVRELTVEDIWKYSKTIKFHLRQPSRKNFFFHPNRREKGSIELKPPGPFSICSYPPEDKKVENFGDFLKKKGLQIATEEAARTIPFSNSMEDGIDVKETLCHWHEKKLFVKVKGKPPGAVGSVVIIFDEDQPKEGEKFIEKYPWRTTWLGEHAQESDMSFYATSMEENVIGPGISRCQYGGFMMTYPPRRMFNIWHDPDYENCRTKAEVLLVAAIDYAVQPLVVYVAAKPPRSILKSFAQRYGRKIVYIPIGQISPVTINRIRFFHVLDGHEKRKIADEYISN